MINLLYRLIKTSTIRELSVNTDVGSSVSKLYIDTKDFFLKRSNLIFARKLLSDCLGLYVKGGDLYMTIARLKVDLAENLKEGMELVQYGSVFCNEKTCFTADLIYGNPNFELIEARDIPVSNTGDNRA